MNTFSIRSLQVSDKAGWSRLWSAYLTFYGESLSQVIYDSTWERLFTESEFEPKCLLAIENGKARGIVHYLYHRSCWSVENTCYLQDLYTDPAMRCQGVGGALIEAVRQAAAKQGVTRLYWMTHETNVTARRLYDKIAKNTGFIEYAPAEVPKSP